MQNVSHQSYIFILGGEPGVAVSVTADGLGPTHEVGPVIIQGRAVDIGGGERGVGAGPSGEGCKVRVWPSVKFVQVLVTRYFPSDTGRQQAGTVRGAGRFLRDRGDVFLNMYFAFPYRPL